MHSTTRMHSAIFPAPPDSCIHSSPPAQIDADCQCPAGCSIAGSWSAPYRARPAVGIRSAHCLAPRSCAACRSRLVSGMRPAGLRFDCEVRGGIVATGRLCHPECILRPRGRPEWNQPAEGQCGMWNTMSGFFGFDGGLGSYYSMHGTTKSAGPISCTWVRTQVCITVCLNSHSQRHSK